DEIVGELKLQRVRMAFLHMKMHVQAVIHVGQVAAGLKLLRREQSRQPMVIFRIKPHQESKAPRQQVGSAVQYGTHRCHDTPALTTMAFKTWSARYRSGKRSCWRFPRSTRAWC